MINVILIVNYLMKIMVERFFCLKILNYLLIKKIKEIISINIKQFNNITNFYAQYMMKHK